MSTDIGTIRDMVKRDLDEVVSMEQRAFTIFDEDLQIKTVHPLAWTEKDYLNAIRKKQSRAYICEEGTLLVGFMVIELERLGFNILKLMVDPSYRRSGFGGFMLSHLTEKLVGHTRKDTLRALVYERDEASIAFYRGMNFTSKLVRGAFGEEDGIEFALTIPEDLRKSMSQ